MASSNRAARRRQQRAERRTPPVIVDVTQPVMTYEGKAATENGEPVLIRTLIYQALNIMRPGLASLTDQESYKAYRITQAAVANDKIKLSSSDVTFVLARSGLVNTPLGHGRLKDVLDPDDTDGGYSVDDVDTNDTD